MQINVVGRVHNVKSLGDKNPADQEGGGEGQGDDKNNVTARLSASHLPV